MDSNEENRVLFYRKVKSRGAAGFDQMIEDQKKTEGFDQESSDELQKMRGKPFSSSSELHEAKSKIKTNGAPGSASGSSVRVCDFCGKQFSSGKALGGHRRYHIQAQRKMEAQQRQEKVNNRHHHHQYPSNNYTLRINPNNNNISEDFVGGGVDNDNLIKSNTGDLNYSSRSPSFRCVVCYKDFPSKKSLFGHMRSHPEREWRGMNPPLFTDNALTSSSSAEQFKVVEDDQYQDNNNNNNGSSSSTLEESSVVVDLSSSCSGSSWLKKDRRGRRSIGAAEAAQTLMYMYLCGDNYIHLLPPRELQPPPAAEAEVLSVKQRKKHVGSSSPGKKQRLDDDCKEKLEEAENENNTWDMKVMSLMKEKKLKRKYNKKKIKSEAEGELLIRTLKEQMKSSSSSSSQSYVCSICNKSFSSFQALGGHRSKHNREKNIVISTKCKEVMELLRVEEEQEEEENKVCINGALSNAAGLSSEEELEEGGGGRASLISSEERLVLSSNDHDENNSNEEANHESGGSKILDFDLNVPYVSEKEATEI